MAGIAIPQLLKNIQERGDGPGGSYTEFASLASLTLFAAVDAEHGLELWKTDGTGAGTVLIKDIRPGVAGSQIKTLAAAGSLVYFTATDGARGLGLWRSDGTAEGTFMLMEGVLTPTLSGKASMVTYKEGAVFSVDFGESDAPYGQLVYFSKGTPETTVLLSYGSFAEAVVAGGQVFFSSRDNLRGTELWKTNGTPGGTALVRDIYAGTESSLPRDLTVIGNTVYFRALDGTHGDELWKSDGTAVGTVLVRDIETGANSSSPEELTSVGNTLYFTAKRSATGREVWRSDGTDSGTQMVAQVDNGNATSVPYLLTAVGNTLYFTFQFYESNRSRDQQLWKVLEAGSPQMVKEVATGDSDASIDSMVVSGGRLYFSATTSSSGSELWTSDGTAEGTIVLTESTTDSASHFGGELTPIPDGKVIFWGSQTGREREIWKSNGTLATTVVIAPISIFDKSSDIDEFHASNGTLYFSALDAEHGYELWRSDGTGVGTVLVRDINPGAGHSRPRILGELDGILLFSADDGVNGYQLWKSDGTPEGTTLAAAILPNTSDDALDRGVAYNGYFYFRVNDGVHGTELWRTDGTPENTSLFADLVAGGVSSSSHPRDFCVFNNVLYLRTANAGLWRSDGTPEGTTPLHPSIANVKTLTVGAEGLIFSSSATTGTNESKFQLWKSDGTNATPILLKEIQRVNNNAGFGNFQAKDGAVFGAYYFDDGIADIWRTNGTPQGTVKVATGGLLVTTYLLRGPHLYFTALAGDGLSNNVWCMKDTTATPLLVFDGRAAEREPVFMQGDTGSLFFAAAPWRPNEGYELWKSQGSPENTVQVPGNVFVDARIGGPGQRSRMLGTTLLFSAARGTLGYEPHAMDLRGSLTVREVLASGAAVTLPNHAALDWKKRGVSQAAVKTLRLLNTGDTDLTTLSASIVSGHTADFAIASIADNILTSGAWRNIQVTFTPQAAGTRTAVLRFISSDPEDSPYDITLTGTGQVAAAPELQNGPVSRIALLGQPVSFSANVIAAPVATYAWRVGSSTVGTDPVLSFPTVQFYNTGSYELKVTNGQGKGLTTPVAKLAVVSPVVSEVLGTEGGQMTLRCLVSYPPGSWLRYRWRYNRVPLSDVGRYSGTHSAMLVVSNLQPGDEGAYECIVSMEGAEPVDGVSHGVTSLVILSRPVLQPEPFADGMVGQWIDLRLQASNRPVFWKVAGLPAGLAYDERAGRIIGRLSSPRLVRGVIQPYQVTITPANLAGFGEPQTLPWLVSPLTLSSGYVAQVPRHATLNNGMGGHLKVAITKIGGASGTLNIAGTAYRFTGGVFPSAEDSSIKGKFAILRAGAATLTLDVSFDREATEAMSAKLSLQDGTNVEFAGAKILTSTPAFKASWTAAIEPDEAPVDDAYPAGNGFITLSSTAAGKVTWTGKLADGTKLTGSESLTYLPSLDLEQPGRLWIYGAHPRAQGSWAASLRLDSNGVLAGTMNWFKKPDPLPSSNHIYAGGIALHNLTVTGGKYSKPATGTVIFGLAAPYEVSIAFGEGGLSANLEQPFNLTAQNKVKMPNATGENPNQTKVTLNAATGSFSGSFVLSDPHQGPTGSPVLLKRTVKFEGVILSPEDRGSGFFLLPQLPESGQPPTKVKTTDVLSGVVDLGPVD